MDKRVMLQIRWSEKSLSDFIAILDYIKKDSPTNAKRVKTRINNFIKTIPSKPKMFRKDELKQNNDGTFRVLTKNRIRVSYKIESTEIFIVKVSHSSQEPSHF